LYYTTFPVSRWGLKPGECRVVQLDTGADTNGGLLLLTINHRLRAIHPTLTNVEMNALGDIGLFLGVDNARTSSLVRGMVGKCHNPHGARCRRRQHQQDNGHPTNPAGQGRCADVPQGHPWNVLAPSFPQNAPGSTPSRMHVSFVFPPWSVPASDVTQRLIIQFSILFDEGFLGRIDRHGRMVPTIPPERPETMQFHSPFSLGLE